MAARLFASRTRKGTSAAAQWEKPNLTHEFKGHEGALWEEPILKHKFEGHEKEIWSFVFLHDNIHIVSGSADGTMRKWNCDTGRAVGKPWKGKGGSIYALALSPDGKMIASGSEDGGIQRWNTNGEMMEGVWMSHSDWVQSLSWSPSGSHIASGSENGTVLIQKAESGQVTMGPIETEQEGVCALAYSPSEKRIASGGYNATICIWNTKTGRLTVPSIRHLGQTVTSLVWSSDSTKLYSASDEFARVFNSKTGQLLHRFEHDNYLWSVALSPRNNVLACVGNVVQLWDTESHQPLSQPFHENHEILRCASFSWNGRYMAYGGYDNKLTLCTVEMDIASQLPALMLQQSDRRSTQQEIGSNSPMSPLSSCLDADATGNDGFIEEAHDDPYNNFFQSSHQSLPSPSHLPPLFSARRLWNIISRRRPPPDQSIPRERPRRGLFSHHARSNLSLELATAVSNQLVQEGKVVEGEGEDEQGEIVDDHTYAHDRTLSAHLNSKDYRILWERLIQPRIKIPAYPSTQLANAPQPRILHNSWHWNSSFSAPSSRCPVDIAACRDEDRYGITPESDAEAAAAMLRANDDVADSSTRPGYSVMVANLSQGRPTQPQASTSGPQEIEVICCGFSFSCRRHSN